MSFNYPNIALGGLMGATPYSNVQILDAFTVHQHNQQMLRNYQQQRGHNQHHRTRGVTPTAGTSHQHQHPLMAPQAAPTPPVIKFRLPQRVIQDVLCRFIMNIPEEEKFDPVRALFQVELAHWFFIDHYCTDEGDPALASLGHIPFNQFAYIMFKEAPHLRQYYVHVDKYLADFRSYRSRVPTYGAILMNEDLTQVLLVQGFRNQWGFPKGKVNENEDPIECAIREVFEETGYNMRPLINPAHFIESKTQDRNDRLYLVRGVDTSYPFFPQTQYEIKQISWFNICEIPEHKKDGNPKILQHGQSVANFFTIYTYVKRLKLWITDKLEGRNRIQCFRSKYGQNQDEEENCTVEESYARQPGYTINTPAETYTLERQTASSSTAATSADINSEELIRVLGGMRLTPVPDSYKTQNKTPGGQGQCSSSVGGSSKKKDQHKGTKSKKRLFPDKGAAAATKNANNASASKDVQTRNAQEAADFLSSAMGIPVSVNLNLSKSSTPLKQNGNGKNMTLTPSTSTPTNSTQKSKTSNIATSNSAFFGNLPSTAGLRSGPFVKEPKPSTSCSMTFPPLPPKPDYTTNFNVTAKCWENFQLDKEKLMSALQIESKNPPPPP